MKKSIISILSVAMLLGLASCGTTNPGGTTTPEQGGNPDSGNTAPDQGGDSNTDGDEDVIVGEHSVQISLVGMTPKLTNNNGGDYKDADKTSFVNWFATQTGKQILTGISGLNSVTAKLDKNKDLKGVNQLYIGSRNAHGEVKFTFNVDVKKVTFNVAAYSKYYGYYTDKDDPSTLVEGRNVDVRVAAQILADGVETTKVDIPSAENEEPETYSISQEFTTSIKTVGIRNFHDWEEDSSQRPDGDKNGQRLIIESIKVEW